MRRAIPALALAALVTVSLSGCGGPSGETVPVTYQLPSEADATKTLEGPITWYSGVLDVFDAVAKEVPGIAELRDAVEEEDAAFGAKALEALGTAGAPSAMPAPSWYGGRTSRSDDGARAFENLIVGALGGQAQRGVIDAVSNGYLQPGSSGDDNGTQVTVNDDGTVTIEISAEGRQGSGATTASTSLSVVYDGKYCPGPDGRFDATAKSHRSVAGSAGGASSSRTEDVKANISGTLGENALPEEITIEATQMTSETGTDGSTQYITTTQRSSEPGFGGLDPAKNPPKKLGGSKGLSDARAKELTEKGQGDASIMLLGLLAGLTQLWSDGGCVGIDADLPESVQAKSVNDFTIKVKQKLTGSSVKGPLTLELTGDEDLNPTDSVSPGGFHYTAGEEGTSATIKITSTSRQGGATKTVTVTTGSMFRVVGGWGSATIDQTICGSQVFDMETWGLEAPGGGYTFTGKTMIVAYTDQGGAHSITLTGNWALSRDGNGNPTAIDGTASGFEASGVGSAAPSIAPINNQAVHFTITPTTKGTACDG